MGLLVPVLVPRDCYSTTIDVETATVAQEVLLWYHCSYRDFYSGTGGAAVVPLFVSELLQCHMGCCSGTTVRIETAIVVQEVLQWYHCSYRDC